jgi:multidrug efflux system membrane fusion protein
VPRKNTSPVFLEAADRIKQLMVAAALRLIRRPQRRAIYDHARKTNRLLPPDKCCRLEPLRSAATHRCPSGAGHVRMTRRRLTRASIMSSEASRLSPPPQAAQPRVVSSRYKRVLLVAGGLVVAFLCWEIATRLVAYTADAYVRSDLIGVAPQVTGRILAVHVHDNQTVRRGDPLVSIDPEPFRLAVEGLKAQIREAEAQAAADRDAAAGAKALEEQAAAALQLAQVTQRRIAKLSTEGDATAQALDSANEALRRAETGVDAARAAIARDQQMLAMHEAGIARAQAELATAHWRLERTEVRALADGTINNLTVRVGDTARAEVPLIGVVDAAAWRIVANYKQDYLRYFRVGGTAWVWLDSHPWQLHRARITGVARAINREQAASELLPYVAPTTDWIRLQRRFPVTLVLVDPPEDLTLYMGADARTLIFPW